MIPVVPSLPEWLHQRMANRLAGAEAALKAERFLPGATFLSPLMEMARGAGLILARQGLAGTITADSPKITFNTSEFHLPHPLRWSMMGRIVRAAVPRDKAGGIGFIFFGIVTTTHRAHIGFNYEPTDPGRQHPKEHELRLLECMARSVLMAVWKEWDHRRAYR